jgi:hypothetical protein
MGYLRDVKDPDNKGRIRCHCPELMGDADNSSQWLDWALPAFPWIASRGVGFNFIPSKDFDKWGAWLFFRQGDPRFPVWFGLVPWQAVDTTQTTVSASDKVALDVSKGGKIQLSEAGSAPDAIVRGTTWWKAESSCLDDMLQALATELGGCVGMTAGLGPGVQAEIDALTAFQKAGANQAFLSKVSFTK